MSAAQEKTIVIDLDGKTARISGKDDLYQGDSNANEISIEFVRKDEKAILSGYTVSGEFERSDETKVPCEGSVNENVAKITLNEHCYVRRGPYRLTVRLSKSAEKINRTILEIMGEVQPRGSGPTVDINETLVNVDKVLELYNEMNTAKNETVNAKDAANAAASKANAAAGRAPYIGANGHWYIWNEQMGEYVDSTNPSMPNPTFEVRTGEPGTQVQIAQSGTAENPIIILTIPRGDTGAVDGIDYYEGSPSALGTASPGTANGVARGNHVHPMPTAEDVGALPKDGTAEDASKLGGILADDYAQKAYANSNVYHLRGKLLNSGSDSVTAYGMATALLMPGGVARIDFVAKVETAGNVDGNYAWGLNRDYFTALTGKTITPQAGGVLQYFNTNGNVWAERQGYGGTFNNSGQFWCPARVYDTNGAIGGWGSNAFPAGTIFAGTCYGLYN